jgi:hypothetical protein
MAGWALGPDVKKVMNSNMEIMVKKQQWQISKSYLGMPDVGC